MDLRIAKDDQEALQVANVLTHINSTLHGCAAEDVIDLMNGCILSVKEGSAYLSTYGFVLTFFKTPDLKPKWDVKISLSAYTVAKYLNMLGE